MSDAFSRDLNLPAPHIHLNVGSGTHAEQTGGVLIAYAKVLVETKPDLVVVVGDVNSTVACTLSAVKLGIKLAHLEAVFKVKDKKSLHRCVLLLNENILRIVRKEIYQKQQLETKSSIKNLLADSQKQQESNFIDQRFEDMNNRIKHI